MDGNIAELNGEEGTVSGGEGRCFGLKDNLHGVEKRKTLEGG
jgi:hypothetical protein